MSLNRDQRVALIREVDATSTLFRHGFSILREYRFAATDAEAVFVCLAGGSEKLLKLSVGLAATDDTGDWPSKAEMQKVGHRVVRRYGGVEFTCAACARSIRDRLDDLGRERSHLCPPSSGP